MTEPSTINVEIAAAGSVVSAVLGLVQELLPAIGISGSSAVTAVLTALEAVVPLLVKAAPALIDEVKAVIADIKSSGKATPAQIDQADALAAKVDAAWSDAVAAYGANHPEGA